ncbi:MAG: 4-hydroxyphenylacetate 3-hydroxylase [Aigarchaeota archaeon]|nr:4-hydroxyphenylacetate 3-hydroxylase [Candidatus Pelearchaeum maunauluense]
MPIRRGVDYIASLRERQPTVYYEGKRVENVVEHPAFKIPIQTLARIYDLQWSPEYQDKLTYLKNGQRTNITYMIPRSKEDLRRIREALNIIYDNLLGFFGRCYDYLNMWMAIFAAHAWDFFGDKDPLFADNAISLYEHCSENDLFLTHAIVAPMVDRSKMASQLVDPYIQAGVVEKNNSTVVVRGAAMVSTAAPYAEELIYFPNLLRDPDPRYAIAFVCPTNLDGIKFIARRSFKPRDGYGEFEYPISSRFEESDAFVVFDNVKIPKENFLFLEEVDKVIPMMWGGVYMKAWFNYHFNVQYYSRLKFLTGLATLIAQAVGIDKFVNVQEKLGELLIYLNITRAAIIAAEDAGEKLDNGLYRPNPEIAVSVSHFNMKALPRAFEIIKLLSGGSLVSLPSSRKDLENPEIRQYIDKYLVGAGVSAVERIKLFNLAWDVVCSELGQRYELYDRFSRGDPTVMWSRMQMQFAKQREECVKLAKTLLDSIPDPE